MVILPVKGLKQRVPVTRRVAKQQENRQTPREYSRRRGIQGGNYAQC
jgi:hypothetical protein